MSSRKSTKIQVIDLNKPHTCEFCKKTFTKETTLVSHVCEPKRRWQNQNVSYVKKALLAYNMFYSSLSPGKSVCKKSYQEFASSNYYSAFVKFGSWCEENQAQEWAQFTQWLLANNIKLDLWCDQIKYREFLDDLIDKEPAVQALSRSLQTITGWSQDTGRDWSKFFETAHPNVVVSWVSQGKISPWLLYNSDSAVKFLERCSQEQLHLIQQTASIKKWKVRFMRMKEDADIIRHTLQEAGL
jgi:hypothetical protein